MRYRSRNEFIWLGQQRAIGPSGCEDQRGTIATAFAHERAGAAVVQPTQRAAERAAPARVPVERGPAESRSCMGTNA